MNEKYRVAWYIDSTYQVLDRETDEQLYQGSLSDCDGMEKMLRRWLFLIVYIQCCMSFLIAYNGKYKISF